MENTSYAFMARKFPNIRFKRKQPFKARPQGQPFNKNKTHVKPSKGKYKTGYVDRSSVRCYKCDDLGHFANECKKPKKKDKEFLELEAKYEALFRKQTSGKAKKPSRVEPKHAKPVPIKPVKFEPAENVNVGETKSVKNVFKKRQNRNGKLGSTKTITMHMCLMPLEKLVKTVSALLI